MQTTLTLTLVAACCVGTVLTSPLRAQEGRAWYAPPASVYQAPGGGYPTLSDFSRDVWGVPCGVECTREAQARWARYYYYNGFNGRYPGRDPYGQ
jgi:hypothetical protein